ncbi:hypothetical protein N7540_007726 [Penicillium herquei]|nr:hypothetical protein N7540_007726 [Penicillium herquei]
MAWGWEQSDDAHRQVYGREEEPQHHEAKFSHELIAGAASFAGMKAWEDHQRKEGKTVKHAFAKEALAGLVGAEVDKLVESKGMDEVDKIKAHHHAKQNAEKMYEEHYESRGGEEWHQGYERHERFERFGPPGGGRFDGPPGGRFDGPPGGRFDGPPGGRFDGPPGGRFDGPPGGRFDGPPGGRW